MIVLYNPQSSRQRRAIIPFSLLSLGTLLEGRHEYAVVDGNLSRDSAAEIGARLGSAGVLAVTVMPGPQVPDALRVTRQVKRQVRNLTTVWGGYFPTQHPETCLREPAIDYVTRGFGEHSFSQLVEHLQNGRTDLGDIPGLCRRVEPDSTGRLTPRSSGEPVMLLNDPVTPPDPNLLPEFPYHRINMAAYAHPTFLGRRTLSHHSSFGCPFTCNYCAVTGLAQGKYRAETPARTASVLERLVNEFGADSLQFYDNNFFVDEDRTAVICEHIKSLRIAWWAQGRLDTLLKWSARTWRLMAESGLKMVFMGAEAVSDQRLQQMHRGGAQRADSAIEMAGRARQYGIIPEFSFVMGAPPDPAEDINDTLASVRRIKRVNPDSEIVLYLYAPVPVEGSMYREARQRGFRFPDTLDEWASEKWVSFIQRRSRVMPWLPRGVHARLRGFEMVLNAYYPTQTNPGLTRWRRTALRVLSAWRYHLEFYLWPLELRVLTRLFRYQRPETTGF